MKTIFSLILLSFFAINSFSQNQQLPNVNVRTLDGRIKNTETLVKEGKPILVDFWATWCKPCVVELSTLSDLYDDWQDETGIIIYAVSIDDAKTTNRVAAFVSGRDWNFNILLDPNSDFKRAMNVTNVPQSFLINSKGKIVWKHIGFAPGDEEEMYKQILKLTTDTKSQIEIDDQNE